MSMTKDWWFATSRDEKSEIIFKILNGDKTLLVLNLNSELKEFCKCFLHGKITYYNHIADLNYKDIEELKETRHREGFPLIVIYTEHINPIRYNNLTQKYDYSLPHHISQTCDMIIFLNKESVHIEKCRMF
jgi:hypothetical protein